MPKLATLPRASPLQRLQTILASVPAGLGGAVLVSRLLRADWSGQLWAGAPGVTAYAAAAFLLGGVLLVVQAVRPLGGRPVVGWTLFLEAMVGSGVAAIACSTFIGYAADLPAAASLFHLAPIAPATAAAMLGAGLALVVHAWRDNGRREAGPPEWAPVPAV